MAPKRSSAASESSSSCSCHFTMWCSLQRLEDVGVDLGDLVAEGRVEELLLDRRVHREAVIIWSTRRRRVCGPVGGRLEFPTGSRRTSSIVEQGQRVEWSLGCHGRLLGAGKLRYPDGPVSGERLPTHHRAGARIGSPGRRRQPRAPSPEGPGGDWVARGPGTGPRMGTFFTQTRSSQTNRLGNRRPGAMPARGRPTGRRARQFPVRLRGDDRRPLAQLSGPSGARRRAPHGVAVVG